MYSRLFIDARLWCRWRPGSRSLRLLSCFAFLCFTAAAQYEHTDAIVYNDTVKIHNRFKETEKKIREDVIDIDGSIAAYQDLLALSRAAHFKRGILVALWNLRIYYERKGEKRSTSDVLREAIQVAGNSKEYQPYLVGLYNYLAIALLHANKLDSAAFYFLKSARLANAEGDLYSESASYNNVSNVFRLLNMSQQQLDYLHKALAINIASSNDKSDNNRYIKRWKNNQSTPISTSKFNTLELRGKIYKNIADAYIQMDNEDSIAIGKSYLHSAFKLVRQYNMPDLEKDLFTSLAVYYMDQKQYKEAIPYFKKAICTKTPSQSYRGLQYAKQGECYFRLKDYKKAAILLEKAIDEAHKYKVDMEVSNFYVMLAKIYEAMGKYKNAAKYYNLYIVSEDSIDGSNVENAVYGLQYQYETAQKDNEILNNRLKISEQKAIIDRNRIMILSLILIALLTTLSVWLYLRYRRRLQRQTEKQALEIAAWRASLDGEEKERRRLAKELHDNIGGNLSTLKMWLGNIRDNNTSDLTSKEQDYNGALLLLDHTLMEVRNTAHHLMPELLLRLGLAEAIRVYCNDVQQATGIRVNYQYLGYIGQLDNNMELLIYRTVQELVQNVIKHAKANYLLVQLTQFDKTLSITIEDNGLGMNTAASPEHKGMGLSSIKYSIEKLNGAFRIHSESGNGTTVEIELNTENNMPAPSLSKQNP